MRILSWNCGGLGKPSAVRALKKLLRNTCPDVVFLMETKLSQSDKKAMSTLSFGPLSNVFMVNCTLSNSNRSGGLALIWNNDVKITILDANKMMIDEYITSCNTNHNWYATGYYGSPYHNAKHLTCESINNLYNSRKNDSWLIFGDFNLVLNHSEKLGGADLDAPLTNLFNNTLNNCDLTDLGFIGYKYTWANNQANHHHIQERLDRYCANSNWISKFPRYLNKHLLRYTSDHAPILLEFFDFEARCFSTRQQRIKRFEQLWADDKESLPLVKANWEFNTGDCKDKLDKVLCFLDSWGRQKFGDSPMKVKKSQEALKSLKNRIPTEENLQQIKDAEKNLDDLLNKEEQWWSQRAKVHWLKFGDLNTKYFHYKAS